MLKNKYTFVGYLKLLRSYLYTKIFHRKCRIIRLPIDLRGSKNIHFGQNLTTGVGCRLECFGEGSKLVFGNNVQINDYVHISVMKSVEIGNNVLMASNIYISDNSHGVYIEDGTSPMIPPIQREYKINSVVIEENVWIGEGVIILPGITIGKGAVIGAHSVVNKSRPEYSIADGYPIKIVKKYNFETEKWIKI